ncbi:MAG: ribonuclease HI [Desulfovibrio sp.]|nr:ribonuclease HI [Desulfovibrio sp.]
MKEVVIHTDGACLGNPGPGGWAALLRLEGSPHRRELTGGFRLTTNNRMEIMAVLEGLGALREPCRVSLYTDSRYVRDAVEKGWLDSWRAKNWRKADNKPVKNVDLWQRLLPLLTRHQVRFVWLRGHAGHEENARCDELAGLAARGINLPEDAGWDGEERQ